MSMCGLDLEILEILVPVKKYKVFALLVHFSTPVPLHPNHLTVLTVLLIELLEVIESL